MQSSFPHLGKSQGSAFQSAMDTPSPGKTTFLIMPTSQIPALWQPSVCSLDLGQVPSDSRAIGGAPRRQHDVSRGGRGLRGRGLTDLLILGALSPWSAGAFLQFAAKSALQFFTLRHSSRK
uniref:Uncharacterized protein n=1 Tax=Molossus molossus TaxID=27622 RepID=A0A7J8GLX5_MOLMO|nr:hypothetical protein HJG59_011500 [Molossus molossus]